MKLSVPEQVKAWVPWVGRRVDDAELRARLRQEGVTRLPRALAHEIPVSVVRPARKLGFGFTPFVAHERYPPVATRGGFVPYLSSVQFDRDVWCREVPRQGTLAELKRVLGPPSEASPWVARWSVALDARGVGLAFERDDLGSVFWSLGVLGGTYLWVPSMEPLRAEVAITLAWLLRNGLLQTAPLAAHQKIVKAVARRETNPGALLEVYPLGWWKEHVKPRLGLRDALFGWLNGESNEPLAETLGTIDDLDSPLFGQPAVLDDWATFDACRPVLDRFFKKWRARRS